ncbi:hypothetical protein EIP86_001667 [Pleurotus ostreatoroseus]|nr:hypothetical protein EIP86_001667 [Pleurotus ostreatoroseus]
MTLLQQHKITNFTIPKISSTSSPQPQIVDDIIQQQRIVSAALLEINRLKTLWYATLPIARIPPEILATIFVLDAESARVPIAAFDEEARRRWPTLEESYSWLRVCLVCRHWREVALQCPSLWAFIGPTTTQFVELSLQRSAQHPLTVTTRRQYGGFVDTPTLFGMLLGSCSRIEMAEIGISGKLRFTDAEAPLLHTLHIQCNESLSTSSQESMFKAGGTPNLSKLSYSGSLRWNLLQPLLHSQLTVLRLEGSQENEPIPAESWVDALQNMPSLRSLQLHKAIGRLAEPEAADLSRQISLPHLEVLRVQTGRDHSKRRPRTLAGHAYVFNKLEIPASVKIEYIVDQYFTMDSDRINFVSRLSAHVAEHQHSQMAISYERSDVILKTGLQTQALSNVSSADNSIRIRTSVVEEMPLQLSSHISLQGITEMRIDFAGYDASNAGLGAGEQMLEDIFCGTPHLRTLTVTGDRALYGPPLVLQPRSEEDNSTYCLLPTLQVLTIENALWHHPDLEDLHVHGESLRHVLWYRRQIESDLGDP